MWVVSIATKYMGPQSSFGQLLIHLGLSVNADSVVPYILGFTIVLIVVYLVGLIVETSLGPWSARIIDRTMRRIPVVGTVYDMSKRFVSVIDTDGGSNLKSMSPVWCFFGGEPGAAVLALLTSPEPVKIGKDEYFGVLIPTAPVPIGGCLIYIPAKWVRPAEESVDQFMSVYLSMGVTPPQSIAETNAAQNPSNRSS